MNKPYWLFFLFIPFLLNGCAASATTIEPSPEPSPAPSPEPTLSPTSTPIPTEVPPSIQFESAYFTFQGDDPSIPIVTHNPSTEMENLYINPGAVLFHEGRFHMFFNSFTNWPGIVQIGYMTSDDGQHWQMVQDTPVYTTDQIPFGDDKADISSVLVMDDGTWVMYFHTVVDGEIGRATASSPLGPWTADEEPILKPGPDGSWDQRGLGWPSVVRNGSEYFMYYGAQSRTSYAIGLATSSDGILWTKYNEPETTDEKFAESDPVLVSEAKWESIKLDRPRVTLSPDGFVLIYQGGTALENRGLAVSEDGIHWYKHPSNPIISQNMFPISSAKTWDTSLLYHDGTYYYIMEIGSLSGTNLYLASYEGTLKK